MSVYSNRLLQVAAGTTAVITAPAGFRTIVRDIDLFKPPTAGPIVEAYVAGPLGQAFAFVQWTNAGIPETFSWRGRQVIEPGEVWFFNSSAAIDATVSGYLLSLP